MSSNPRSAVLAANAIGTAGQTLRLFTVPAGITVIVKSVVITNLGGTAANVRVNVQSAAVGIVATLLEQSVSTTTPLLVNTSVVMGPGNIMVITSDVTGPHVWVSGTILQGVAQALPVVVTLPRIDDFMPLTNL